MAKKPTPIVVSTGYVVMSTGRYFKVRTDTGGSYDFLLNGHGTPLEEIAARQREIQGTADKWQRQADLLKAALKFTTARTAEIK